GSDTPDFSQAFSDANVGVGKTLIPSGHVNDGNSGNNYSITFSNASSGVISIRPITVTADALTKTYGNADPAFTYQITNGSLVNGDAITGAMTRVAGENVGTYAIQRGALTAGSNYDLTFVSANLTISARSITVTANSQTKEYGSTDPALTYSV